MRAHLSKFLFIYLWITYLIWIVIRIIFRHDQFTPLNWINWMESTIGFLFGLYQLSEVKMDLDLQDLRDIDQGKA